MIKWGLYTIIVVYNILDVWQTHLLLMLGAKELNPIFNFLGQYFGIIPSIIYVKVILLGFLGVLLYNYKTVKYIKEIDKDIMSMKKDLFEMEKL